jgi:hypothetical protein
MGGDGLGPHSSPTRRISQRAISTAIIPAGRSHSLFVCHLPSGNFRLCLRGFRSVERKRPTHGIPSSAGLRHCLVFRARARYSTVGPELIDLPPEAAANGGNRASE